MIGLWSPTHSLIRLRCIQRILNHQIRSGNSLETARKPRIRRQAFPDKRLPTARNESPRCEYRKSRKELSVPRSNGQREICSLGTRHLQVPGGSATAKWSRYIYLGQAIPGCRNDHVSGSIRSRCIFSPHKLYSVT